MDGEMLLHGLVPPKNEGKREVYDWDAEGKPVWQDYSPEGIFARRIGSLFVEQAVDGSVKPSEEEKSGKTLALSKDSVISSLRKAQNELFLANDLLTLLTTRSTAAKAAVQEQLPIKLGSLGTTVIPKAVLPFLQHPHVAQRQMRERMALKWISLEACHDALSTSLANSRAAMNAENRFWRCAIGLRDRGWGLSCVQDLIDGIDTPRRRRRLVVRFGLDAMSQGMKKNCVVILDRDRDGRPHLQRAQGGKRLSCQLMQLKMNGSAEGMHPLSAIDDPAEPDNDLDRLDQELRRARAEMIDLDIHNRCRAEARDLGILDVHPDTKNDVMEIKIAAACFLRMSMSTEPSASEPSRESSDLVTFDLGRIIYHTLRVLYLRSLESSRDSVKIDLHGDVVYDGAKKPILKPVIALLTDWILTRAVQGIVQETRDMVKTCGYELQSSGSQGLSTTALPALWKTIFDDRSTGYRTPVVTPARHEIALSLAKRSEQKWSIIIDPEPVISFQRADAIVVPCTSESELRMWVEDESVAQVLLLVRDELSSQIGSEWQFKVHEHVLLAVRRQDAFKVEWKGHVNFQVTTWRNGVAEADEEVQGPIVDWLSPRLRVD